MPSILWAQNTKRDSLWMLLKPFVGTWKGQGEGQPGKGKYERSYQFILNKRFIEISNKSTYPPSTQHPNGEVHEDIGYFSYDNSRKAFMVQYKLDSITADKKILVFVSEAIENIPAGFKTKETYRIINENEIEETFEISELGKEYSIYTIVKLIRQK